MTVTNFIDRLKESHDAYTAMRRDVISIASEMQTLSKRAIFAFQRGEGKEGAGLIARAEELYAKVLKMAETNPRITNEGAFRAALEEHAEAVFFRQVLENGEVSFIEGLDAETQIGGLSDTIGEVVRRMTVLVTEGDFDGARALKKSVEPIMEGLNRMDYRGGLRAKYDQAVRHYRKTEDILYDISFKR